MTAMARVGVFHSSQSDVRAAEPLAVEILWSPCKYSINFGNIFQFIPLAIAHGSHTLYWPFVNQTGTVLVLAAPLGTGGQRDDALPAGQLQIRTAFNANDQCTGYRNLDSALPMAATSLDGGDDLVCMGICCVQLSANGAVSTTHQLSYSGVDGVVGLAVWFLGGGQMMVRAFLLVAYYELQGANGLHGEFQSGSSGSVPLTAIASTFQWDPDWSVTGITSVETSLYYSTEGHIWVIGDDYQAAKLQLPPTLQNLLTSAYSLTAATLCPAGHQQMVDQPESCQACAPGYEAPVPGSFNNCQQCAAGRYSSSYGATSCQACQPGRYSKVAGSTGCVQCEPGYYQPYSSQTNCLECGEGSAAPGQGSSQCNPCFEGSFSSTKGATHCEECALGYYSTICPSTGCSSCKPCPAGTYSGASKGSNYCAQCQPGTFAPRVAATICTPCPAGSFQPASQATSCKLCAAGMHSSGAGDVTCHKCFPGYYAPRNSSQCTACSPGSAAPHAGAASCEICPPGRFSGLASARFADDGAEFQVVDCAACPDNTYAPSNSSRCWNCPPGTAFVASQRPACAGGAASLRDCTPCPAGFYRSSVEVLYRTRSHHRSLLTVSHVVRAALLVCRLWPRSAACLAQQQPSARLVPQSAPRALYPLL